MQVVHVATLAAYALLLSVWSAVICHASAGVLTALLGAMPVFGWLFTIIRFGILATPFGLMVAFWFVVPVMVVSSAKLAK